MQDLFSDLLHAASKVASFVQSAPVGVPERVWAEVSPWVSKFVSGAAAKWLPVISAEFECEVLSPDVRSSTGWASCTHHAVTVCDCCGLRTCLHHCRIDSDGGAICLECVSRARQAVAGVKRVPPAEDPRRPPRPAARQPRPQDDEHRRRAERAWALMALGLGPSASDAEIKSTVRKLSSKWHPDKFETKGAAAKKKAEEKFKEIQRAWSILEPPQPAR